MEAVIKNGIFAAAASEDITMEETTDKMTLLNAEIGQTYIIKDIDTEDEEMNSFLFRLGCYRGEPITLISKKRKSCIVVIKDSRYGLDNQLAEAVIV